jgi:hypothetical protein
MLDLVVCVSRCYALHCCLQEGLPTWLGSSLADVLRSQGGLTMSSSSSSTDGHRAAEQQQQQQGLRTVHDALVAHPTCFTSGLGLDAWQYEGCVTATATVHVASQRNTSVYGYTGGTRCVRLGRYGSGAMGMFFGGAGGGGGATR